MRKVINTRFWGCMFLFCHTAVGSEGVQWPAITPPLPPNPELEQRIDDLLARMTLEQKVGQMIQAEIAHVTPEDVATYRLGSILNGGGSHPGGNRQASQGDWVALAEAFHQASMSPVAEGVAIPILWGTDAVHGHNNVRGATLFPHNIGLGAADDPELMRRIGTATAREVAATGIGWTFAPTLAVARDDRWGRTYESYSEDPERVARLGRAMVEGLQGRAGDDDFLSAAHVVATAKHFIGDGATLNGVDQGDAVLDEATLRDLHGAGYFSTFDAGVQTVMITFNSVNGAKVHGDRHLITDVLKGQMGFDGLVVSDWNGVGQVAGCTNASCPQAINAGIDLVMVPEDWKAFRQNLLDQVRDGTVPLARIEDAVRRILRVKIRAGLLDGLSPLERPLSGDATVIGAPEHRALAREAVRRSLVLLKNEGSLLPLAPGLNVLVAGDGADDIGKQSGGWTISWQGTGNGPDDFPGATSIADGIGEVVRSAGGRLLRGAGPWLLPEDKPDVAIVVFGEDPYAEGQGDRQSLDFSAARPEALEMMRALRAKGIPVVAVLLAGRPLWVNPELNAADAFVVAWLPGSEGGGVADVLFSDAEGGIRYDFEGRLAFSWPASSKPDPVNLPDEAGLFAPGFGLSYASRPEPLGPFDEARHAASGAAAAVALFDARPVPPWSLFVGDPADWKVPVAGDGGRSRLGNVVIDRIDRQVQEDSLRLTWQGAGQVYFQADGPRDLTALRAGGAALQMLIRVIQPPAAAAELRMDCGYPCTGSLDLAERLRGAPQGEWIELNIGLDCFAAAGAKLEAIDTALLLSSTGEMVLDLASARIEVGEAGAADPHCTQQP